MSAIVRAILWVWDFVVGDVYIVGGVVVAILVTLGVVHATSGSGISAALFVALVALALVLSLYLSGR